MHSAGVYCGSSEIHHVFYQIGQSFPIDKEEIEPGWYMGVIQGKRALVSPTCISLLRPPQSHSLWGSTPQVPSTHISVSETGAPAPPEYLVQEVLSFPLADAIGAGESV